MENRPTPIYSYKYGVAKLTQAYQKSMALAGAVTWAVYADNANHKMDDFIGFAEIDQAANFYYRKGLEVNMKLSIFAGEWHRTCEEIRQMVRSPSWA